MTVAQAIAEFKANLERPQIETKVEAFHAYTDALGEYFKQISGLQGVQDEILAALELLAVDRCHEDQGRWIWAAQFHPDERYTPLLCQMLELPDNCIWHEGIVDALNAINDPRSVPCLEKTIAHEIGYDPFNAVARRAIETLEDIGTPEAIEAIKKYKHSPHWHIRKAVWLIIQDLQRPS